jgi:hypothetical protein
MSRGWYAVVDDGVAAGDFVELFRDQSRDDVGADGGVVAAVVEETDGQRKQGVVSDTVEFGAIDGEVLIAGGNGSYVDQDDSALGSVAGVIVLYQGAGVLGGLRGVRDGVSGLAEGTGRGGWSEEAIAYGNGVLIRAEAGDVEPDVLDGVVGAEAGGVSGECDGLLGMGEEHVPSLLGAAVAKHFEKTLGVDSASPGPAIAQEAIGAELDEQDAGLGVVGEIVVQGEVVSDGEYGVRDGYVTGFEAGIALDDIGVNTGHCGGIAEDKDVTVTIGHLEDSIVGTDPDAGPMVEEKIGTT